jgi:hypothetical protein
VVVAYEDVASRNSAIQLCDRVFQEFNGDLDFKADWWAFKYLGTPELGELAAAAAANSDLVIVSADGGGEFPLDIKHWFERWLSKLSKRAQSEGALVSLVPPAAPANQGGSKENYLRTVARRANLDYLPLGSSTREVTSRAQEVWRNSHTPVVEDTAEHRYHIPNWGINE